MTDFEVNKEIVLSTAHIPQRLAEQMDNDVDCNFAYDKFDYGYRVFVSETNEYPSEMKKAIDKAKELGCKWLVYDCDGIKYKDFETFEW